MEAEHDDRRSAQRLRQKETTTLAPEIEDLCSHVAPVPWLSLPHWSHPQASLRV
jgi:hypothetical protein